MTKEAIAGVWSYSIVKSVEVRLEFLKIRSIVLSGNRDFSCGPLGVYGGRVPDFKAVESRNRSQRDRRQWKINFTLIIHDF